MTTPPVSDHDTADDMFASTTEPSASRRALRSLIEWVVIIGGALVVAFLVKTFLVQVFFIPSDSMVPVLERQDRVVVNKVSYDLHEIHRGDIVVFERPPCAGASAEIKDLIKRVVALGGETVEAHDGTIFIDGRRLAEPYLTAGTTTSDFEEHEVPAGHVWLMGDNRGNSRDSRHLCNGPTPIAEDLVIGRAFVRIWPLSRVSRL
jgi:signal peptidase I